MHLLRLPSAVARARPPSHRATSLPSQIPPYLAQHTPSLACAHGMQSLPRACALGCNAPVRICCVAQRKHAHSTQPNNHTTHTPALPPTPQASQRYHHNPYHSTIRSSRVAPKRIARASPIAAGTRLEAHGCPHANGGQAAVDACCSASPRAWAVGTRARQVWPLRGSAWSRARPRCQSTRPPRDIARRSASQRSDVSLSLLKHADLRISHAVERADVWLGPETGHEVLMPPVHQP